MRSGIGFLEALTAGVIGFALLIRPRGWRRRLRSSNQIVWHGYITPDGFRNDRVTR